MSDDLITAYTKEVIPECHWVSLDDFMKMKKFADKRIAELNRIIAQKNQQINNLIEECGLIKN